MHYIIKRASIYFLFCISSWLYSEYSVENAFPNLSFIDPVGIYHAGDDSDKLYVVEQPGTIKIFSNDQSTSVVQTFLDLTPIVNQGTGYTEDGVSFNGVISVIRANPTDGRIIGVIWGR